jgi:hypothetical protein
MLTLSLKYYIKKLVKFDKIFMKKKKSLPKKWNYCHLLIFDNLLPQKKTGSYTYSLRVGGIVCLLLGVSSLHSQWSRHKYTSCFVGGIFTNVRCLPQIPKLLSALWWLELIPFILSPHDYINKTKLMHMIMDIKYLQLSQAIWKPRKDPKNKPKEREKF